MKKLIVPVVIGLVVGLGGSVAARVIMGKEPASLEQSLEEAMGAEGADSTAVEPEHADSAVLVHGDSASDQVADSLGQAIAVAVAETTHVVGHPAALAATTSSPASVGDSAVADDSGLPEGALTSAELAKLFASMQARDAAKVLEQMDDFEVQVILGALGNREAAAILSNLSPERAAVISRAVIRGERGGR